MEINLAEAKLNNFHRISAWSCKSVELWEQAVWFNFVRLPVKKELLVVEEYDMKSKPRTGELEASYRYSELYISISWTF